MFQVQIVGDHLGAEPGDPRRVRGVFRIRDKGDSRVDLGRADPEVNADS
jgi:hypothetical protein